jgi:hypothetical protein
MSLIRYPTHTLNSLFPTFELLIQYLQARFICFNGCYLDTYQPTPTQVTSSFILEIVNQSGHKGLKKPSIESLNLRSLVVSNEA